MKRDFSCVTSPALFCLPSALCSQYPQTPAPPALQRDTDATRLYDLAAREAQHQSLSAISDADVEYGNYGRLRRLDGHTGLFLSNVSKWRRGDSAGVILQKLRPMLLASGTEQLKVRLVTNAGSGERYIFTDQFIDGIPVIDAGLNVRTTMEGEIAGVSSRFVPQTGKVPRTPTLTLEVAKDLLGKRLIEDGLASAPSIKLGTEGSLAFWADEGRRETPRLLWLIEARFTTPSGEQEYVRFGVDATTAEVRHSERLMFSLNRTVYSLGYRTGVDFNAWPEQLRLLWGEGSPNPTEFYGDYAYRHVETAAQAWAAAGSNLAYDTIGIVVHHGQADYAAWVGAPYTEPYLVFGNNRAQDMDAIWHEYGHGIFAGWAPGRPTIFKWWDEYWAANEFFGDASAVFTDFYRNGFTDWYVSNVRNLANPSATGGLDWYPDRRHLGLTSTVAYANSTIFSHAIYLMIHGGTHVRAGQVSLVSGPIPAIPVAPLPQSTVKTVLGLALKDLAYSYSQVTGPNLKNATVARANTMFGSFVSEEIRKAWTAVGIGWSCSGPPAVPAFDIEPAYCRGYHDILWVKQPGISYHGETVRSGYTWDYGTTVVDAPSSSCTLNVAGTTRYRMRACNGCGCSDWAPSQSMRFYSPCL